MKFEQVYWNGVVQPRGGVYKDYRFSLASDAGDKLAGAFLSIVEKSQDREVPLSEVTVVVQIDDEVRSYLKGHPVFSAKPGPFLLSCIEEVFWRLKIVIGEHGKTQSYHVVVVAKDGGRVETTVTTKMHYNFGTASLIPLVNYANTDLHAIMRGELEEHPAMSREDMRSWTETKLRDFMVTRRACALERKRDQERTLRRRETGGDDLWLFVDESGDIGFRDYTHHYVNCGVVVKDRDLTRARDRLRKAIEDNWQGIHPGEIHMGHLPASKVVPVTEALAQVFNTCVESCYCYVNSNIHFLTYLLRCEAEHNRTADSPIHTNLADLLASRDGNVGQKYLILLFEELLTQVGIVCLTSGAQRLGVVHDAKHKEWMNDALRRGFERSKGSISAFADVFFGRPLCPTMVLDLPHSDVEPLLWLSDWIAYECGKWVRDGTYKLTPALESILPKVTFIGFGETGEKVTFSRLGGVQTGTFPDWPRDIKAIT